MRWGITVMMVPVATIILVLCDRYIDRDRDKPKFDVRCLVHLNSKNWRNVFFAEK